MYREDVGCLRCVCLKQSEQRVCPGGPWLCRDTPPGPHPVGPGAPWATISGQAPPPRCPWAHSRTAGELPTRALQSTGNLLISGSVLGTGVPVDRGLWEKALLGITTAGLERSFGHCQPCT